MLPRPLRLRRYFSERTQRRVARGLFVYWVLLPTLLHLVWIGWQQSPWQHAARMARVEEHLERWLGLQVTVADQSTPRPGVKRWEGVALSHPETRQQAARFDWIECHQDPEGWRVRIAVGAIERSQWPGLWRSIQERVAQSVQGIPQRVVLECERLDWVDAGKPWPWHRLEMTLDLGQEVFQAEAQWRLSLEDRSPVSLGWIRQHTGTPPSSRLAIDSASHPLPLDWLTSLHSDLPKTPQTTTFQGGMELEWSDDLVRWTPRGTFAALPIDALLPGKLSCCDGSATLILDQGEWENGGWKEAAGTLRGEASGHIRRDLLLQACRWMETRAYDTLKEAPEWVGYDQLQVAFEVRDGISRIRGQVPPPEKHLAGVGMAWLTAGDQTVLMEAQQPHQPLPQMIGWIASSTLPPNDLQGAEAMASSSSDRSIWARSAMLFQRQSELAGYFQWPVIHPDASAVRPASTWDQPARSARMTDRPSDTIR